jgi:O-acetyl-ADP-ribose deacetylase (regulator of RNase III)
MRIIYREGNCVEPELVENSYNLILHIVNDCMVMGSGIAKEIKDRWPHVCLAYVALGNELAKQRATAQGQIQLVRADDDIIVCNLFGQSSIGGHFELPPIRYGAVEEGLITLRERFKKSLDQDPKLTIHSGRIGSGRAGGSWAKVEEIILRVFQNEKDVQWIVYDIPGLTFNP